MGHVQSQVKFVIQTAYRRKSFTTDLNLNFSSSATHLTPTRGMEPYSWLKRSTYVHVLRQNRRRNYI